MWQRLTRLLLALALAPALQCAQVRAQGGGNEYAVEVGTPQQLKTALEKKVPHIIIVEHLDLSTFTNQSRTESGTLSFSSGLGTLLSTDTRSIRVRDTAASAQLRPKQAAATASR